MTTTPHVSPPMNHVLVDFENVHHIDPAIIGAKAVSLTILVGAKQTKLDAETVVKLFEHAASVQLIRLTASDKNAVDFALAYYLGRAVLTGGSGRLFPHCLQGQRLRPTDSASGEPPCARASAS